MASVTQIFETHKSNNKVSREDIKAAISKSVELRALRAALLQGQSPTNLKFPSPSPTSQLSAQDYPVFTPSYEDEPFSGYRLQNTMKNQTLSQSSNVYEQEEETEDETTLSNYNNNISTTTAKVIPSHSPNSEPHICPTRRNSLGDLNFKSISSCNKCNPPVMSKESKISAVKSNNSKNSNTIVPLTDSHDSSVQSQPIIKGLMSRLFLRLKKKKKTGNSPTRTESEEVSQILKDLGILSLETLKKELIEANESRDSAIMEVSEMKSLLGELKEKLECLETYCEELKRSLRQATQYDQNNKIEKKFPKSGKSYTEVGPVNKEALTEVFLQVVSESRQSVRQFCKTLVSQIEESDTSLTENLNTLVRPYKLSPNSKYSKAISYHLEAIINQSLYTDFENFVFQRNGARKILDPRQDRQARFSSFVALKNLSWSEVLRKGTKYHSEEFSKFCDQKMSCVITTLSWTGPWSEQLLQAFFAVAKCVWLLHLLAFSFDPVVGILRVEENRRFDPFYMEDVALEGERLSPYGQEGLVKIMVRPGFYVKDRVLRCKVLCHCKHSSAV